MFITETHIRVRYAETDQMNVVYYGNYAQYFEVARAESIRNLGFSYKEMEEAGVIMPVVEMLTKFLRPAHYDDLLTIKTILRELPVDHRVMFEHEVFNQEKKLLTLGKVTLYFVKMGSFERTVMPESQLRQLTCSRRLTWSWMATAMPADTTMMARIHKSSKSCARSRFSRALKKSRFQMLSQSAIPTLATPSTTMPAVSSQATERYPGAVQ